MDVRRVEPIDQSIDLEPISNNDDYTLPPKRSFISLLTIVDMTINVLPVFVHVYGRNFEWTRMMLTKKRCATGQDENGDPGEAVHLFILLPMAPTESRKQKSQYTKHKLQSSSRILFSHKI